MSVCAHYELVLPIRFVECHCCWDSIPLSIILYYYTIDNNQDIIRISFGVNRELPPQA